METIAHEAEPRPEPQKSGRLIEPSGVARSIAAAAGDPYDEIVVGAPRYDGFGDEIVVRRSWLPTARRLVEAGCQRALVSSARGDAKARRRTQVQEEIRRLWRDEAEPKNMTVQLTADLLGISRAQLYSILDERVGGKGERGTEPAKWKSGADK